MQPDSVPARSGSRWNCGRCGYLALSSPHEDLEDDSGTVVHRCPECGEQWWLDEFTYFADAGEPMTEHVEPWWWLSFADGARPAGEQFLGVAIVQGYTIQAVITESHLNGINPGGEIQFVQIPDEHVPPAEYRNRLLSRAELEEAGLA